MNSGIEHAALMVSEEKTQHDSRKNPKHAKVPPRTPDSLRFRVLILHILPIPKSSKNHTLIAFQFHFHFQFPFEFLISTLFVVQIARTTHPIFAYPYTQVVRQTHKLANVL